MLQQTLDQAREDTALSLAYVAPRYAPFVGGVETHVENLARRAAAHGHHVEVLVQECHRRLPAVEEIDGVTVRRFPMVLPAPNYAVAPGLWSYLARHAHRFDLVHAHSYHALPALAAALTSRRPLVFTPHYHGTGHSPLRQVLHLPYRPLGASIFSRAQAIICVSEAEATLVRRHFPRAAARLTVIPNGVDVRALRVAPPFPTARIEIVSVGRLEPSKNVQHTIQAMAHLDGNFTLRVIGEGSARPALEALTARLGLADRVAFLGRVSDDEMRRWYRTASVCVTNSRLEAFGITLHEALMAGAAVVASDIPAHREVATAHATGSVTLVPVDVAPAMLARAIVAAAGRRRSLVAAARVASWDAVATRTLILYGAVTRVAL